MGENNGEQALVDQLQKLEQQESTWNVVTKGTLEDVKKTFPPNSLYSLHYRARKFCHKYKTKEKDFDAALTSRLGFCKADIKSLRGFVERGEVSQPWAKSTNRSQEFMDNGSSAGQQGMPLPSPAVPGEATEETPTARLSTAGEVDIDELEEGASSENRATLISPASSVFSKENMPNVFEKGSVGENVFHLALLFDRPRQVVDYLVEVFGKLLVNTPYQTRVHKTDPPGLYEGETAIHIAVVKRDLELVKFLVERGAYVRQRAIGTFFQKGSTCYWGEYPLSFAACIGCKDICRYLAANGANVNDDEDRRGNTALHMTVIHGLPEMFDFLVHELAADQSRPNNNGFTVLSQCAHYNHIDLFKHIYNGQRKVAWTYGPVTCWRYPLKEIDSGEDGQRTALKVIVQMGHTLLLADPFIVTILEEKWDKFARRYFYTDMAGFALLMVAFTTLVTLTRRETWDGQSVGVCRDSMFCTDRAYQVVMQNSRLLDVDKAHELWSNSAGLLTPAEHADLLAQYPDVRDMLAPLPVDDTWAWWAVEVVLLIGATVFMALEVLDYYAWYKDRSMLSKRIEDRQMAHSVALPDVYKIPGELHRRRKKEADVEAGYYESKKKMRIAPLDMDSYWSDSSSSSSSSDGEETSRRRLEALSGGSSKSVASGKSGMSIMSAAPTNKVLKMAVDAKTAATAGKLKVTKGTEAFDVDGDGYLNEYEAGLAMQAGADLTLSRKAIVRDTLKDLLYNKLNPASLLVMLFGCVVYMHFFKWVINRGGGQTYEEQLKWSERNQYVELTVGAVAGWLNMGYYGRRYLSFGHLLVMMTKMLSRDLVRFAFLYLCVLVAFAEAFTVLVRAEWLDENRDKPTGDYVDVASSMMALFRFSLGDIQYGAFADHEHVGFINFLFILFAILTNIVLINMLIAMMSNTFNLVSENAVNVWRLQWARIILKMERRLTEKQKDEYRVGEEFNGDMYRVFQESIPLHDLTQDPAEEVLAPEEPEQGGSGTAGDKAKNGWTWPSWSKNLYVNKWKPGGEGGDGKAGWRAGAKWGMFAGTASNLKREAEEAMSSAGGAGGSAKIAGAAKSLRKLIEEASKLEAALRGISSATASLEGRQVEGGLSSIAQSAIVGSGSPLSRPESRAELEDASLPGLRHIVPPGPSKLTSV